ncbi:uncharacterized protein M6B38_375950 [Iris pallida]|uniref:BLOC-1-related complex subunit 6 C-terminal helix domain-containing protein n=1 Tax=Iris pallida TaxID=29817 RepID=A0AAX6G9R0_IRIPA|nr:uncharacterized protein M6B38_375950 [Iris pallida]
MTVEKEKKMEEEGIATNPEEEPTGRPSAADENLRFSRQFLGKKEEIFTALEIVERDSAAIADSYASLFSSLRLALSQVTSTSLENMECFNDIVGSVQESALDAATKGNRYINSCLRLNEELKGMESLSMQLKTLRKNVDTLALAVDKLLRFP